jgi:DNA-binding NarL/FixJ family response regulator
MCVLATTLPGGAIRATEQITTQLPGTTVVLLTPSFDDDELLDAVSAGASGYLLDEIDPERLRAALMGALAGEVAIPRRMVTRIVEELNARSRRRVGVGHGRSIQLTRREWDIVRMMRSDLGTAEMAERLGISEVTVRRHISSVVRGLRVPDRKAARALLERVDAIALR